MRHALIAVALGGCAIASACAGANARVEADRAEKDAQHGGLPFIEDDFEGALARAKAEGKPLFVDAWAPW